MLDKQEIITKYGKHDGNDDHRFAQARSFSQMIDRSVAMCFFHLVELENKGLINLNSQVLDAMSNTST